MMCKLQSEDKFSEEEIHFEHLHRFTSARLEYEMKWKRFNWFFKIKHK